MHPELLSSLAAEHRRDLAAARTARTMSSGSRVLSADTVLSPDTVLSADTAPSAGLVPRARAARVGLRLALPRYRVSWSRTDLSAVAGNRRARSLVIVISATRTL